MTQRIRINSIDDIDFTHPDVLRALGRAYSGLLQQSDTNDRKQLDIKQVISKGKKLTMQSNG